MYVISPVMLRKEQERVQRGHERGIVRVERLLFIGTTFSLSHGSVCTDRARPPVHARSDAQCNAHRADAHWA
jgi:hypothetical protein